MLRTSLFIVLFLLSTPLSAATVRVVWRGEGPPAPREAMLRARRVDGDAPPMAAKVDLPGEARLALAKGTWEITLEGQGIWSAAAMVRANEDAAIDVWPTGRIAGTFKPIAPNDPLPKEMQAQFSGGVPSGFAACAIAGAQWHCDLPRGRHDVRLDPRPYVPTFRWDVRVAAGAPRPFGAIELRRGASVIGAIELQKGTRVPLDLVHVQLAPVRGDRRHALTASVNKRGFFQFGGVAAGDYLVSAEGPEALSDVQSVRVLADRTASLGAPLRLGPPREIRLVLDPPRDPDGEPWRIELSRILPGEGQLSIRAAAGPASRNGEWSYRRAIDGRYEVVVMRKGGGWKFEEVNVAGDEVERRIDVSGQRVAGTVKRGGKPLAARLRFGGEYGAIATNLESNDEGEFEGDIPPGGDQIWDVLVQSENPALKRDVRLTGKRKDDGSLHFDIVLPATRLPGVVVRQNGGPVPKALITVEGETIVQVRAGADGAFEVSGLPEGKYRIMAGTPGFLSDRVEVAIADGDNPPLRLVVKPERVVAGALTFGDLPVGNATLWVEGPPFGGISHRVDPSGRFRISLPPDRPFVDFSVLARGFSVVIVRAAAGTEDLRIPLDQQGGRITLELPEKGAVMVHHRGADLDLWWLVHSYGERPRAVELPPLAPGPYSFCAGGKCVSTTLAPHGTATLSLR